MDTAWKLESLTSWNDQSRACQLFGVPKRGLKVSPGNVEWQRSSYGSDFDTSEIASLAKTQDVVPA